jgi:outer membrane protein OmpA-like peptidoglycan-associated protein
VNGTDNTLGSTVISNTVNVAVNVFAPGQIALTRSVTNSTVGATSPSTDVSGVQKLQASLTNTLSFTYQVTLVGTTTVTAATSYEGFIVDDNCASISFVSGDSASTLTLNVGETWTFKCDLSANQSMRIISSATAYATDGAGVLVHSAAKKADIEILTPSLITKIVPATEYVKYGGSDVFTYSVENNGGTDITAFTVADDSCSPLVRSSVTAAEGFTPNNDNVLDIGEIWNYSCTRTNYTADHMSNFTVSGVTDSLGYNGYTPAPANALVFVIDPTMTVAQTATVYDPGTFTNKANPGTATQGPATQVNANVNDVVVYTYSINSANTTHSTSVAGLNTMLINSITDSRCSPIEPVDRNADTYNDGDSNSNGQLDPGETWLFDCNTVQVTASPAVVDAQATVEAASVASNFTLRPASVRVIVAGATPTATPAPASSEEPSATPTPTVKPTPKPTVTPTPNPTKAAPKKLTLKVYFKGDSPVLTAAAKADLRILAQKAKSYGFATSISSIGRVKETNDKSYDIRLSKQRATNVANYLKTLGVKGSYKLVAAGISPENTAISRRVDLTLQWSAK